MNYLSSYTQFFIYLLLVMIVLFVIKECVIAYMSYKKRKAAYCDFQDRVDIYRSTQAKPNHTKSTTKRDKPYNDRRDWDDDDDEWDGYVDHHRGFRPEPSYVNNSTPRDYSNDSGSSRSDSDSYSSGSSWSSSSSDSSSSYSSSSSSSSDSSGSWD